MKHALVLLSSSVLGLLAACASRDTESAPPGDGRSPKAPDESGAPSVPAARPDSAQRSLEGTEWRLVEVAGKPAVPGLGTRTASVTFERESASVRGNSGLNSFFGPYALDGADLRIENLAMTRMAGEPELMAQETAFVAALQAARGFRIRGDTLELVDRQQTLLARLTAAAN